MPEMNGAELAEQIKMVAPHTRVVMVTAHAAFVRENPSKVANVDIVLSKPFRAQDLLDALQAA